MTKKSNKRSRGKEDETEGNETDPSGSHPSQFHQVSNLEAYKVKDMSNCDVYYMPSFISEETSNEWYASLSELDSSYATDPKLILKYSGQIVDMKYTYPSALRKIQDEVENTLGIKFNHVMLNLYENGTIYIGKHRDNIENKVIASVSLGAPRTFIMTKDKPAKYTSATTAGDVSGPTTSKKRRREEDLVGGGSDHSGLTKKRWTLAPGSLVVMQGETQKHWKHEIPKEPSVKGGRISLTFRQLLT